MNAPGRLFVPPAPLRVDYRLEDNLAATSGPIFLTGTQALVVFRVALVIIGVTTMASAAIFWQLAPDPVRAQDAKRAAESGGHD